jgi:hypothetical protein
MNSSPVLFICLRFPDEFCESHFINFKSNEDRKTFVNDTEAEVLSVLFFGGKSTNSVLQFCFHHVSN